MEEKSPPAFRQRAKSQPWKNNRYDCRTEAIDRVAIEAYAVFFESRIRGRFTIQSSPDPRHHMTARQCTLPVSPSELSPFTPRQPDRFNKGISPYAARGDSVSAVLDSEQQMVPSPNPKPSTIEIREGDWKAYLHCIARCNENNGVLERYGSAAACK